MRAKALHDGLKSAMIETISNQAAKGDAYADGPETNVHGDCYPMRWSEVDLAWMAGLFEGEGYVQGRPKTYSRKDGRTFTTVGFRMAISMIDEDIIKRFHALAGLGTLNGPRLSPSMKSRGAKPLWDFAAHGAEAYELAMALFPLLGKRRQAQMQSAIDAYIASPKHWSRKAV